MSKMMLIVFGILGRRFVIQYLGNDVNGLNSLFASIIAVLSIADLGIASAITYCMYEPIVKGENEKVAALYGLFKKLYTRIGLFMLAAGLVITPFLPAIAKGNSRSDMQIAFILWLVATVLGYFNSARCSLISAYKDDYITTSVNFAGVVLQYIIQFAACIFARSYIIYMTAFIISTVIQMVVIYVISEKKHGDITALHVKPDKELEKEVRKNVGATFFHRAGDAVVNASDSMIISSLIGVITLGKYMNYATIIQHMTDVLRQVFRPLQSILGHVNVLSSKEEKLRYFNFFFDMNFMLGIIFFLGFYAASDDLVALVFGRGLKIDKTILIIVTIDFFLQFMRECNILFRGATGAFYYDRHVPIIEAAVNVVLSIALGQRFGIAGVLGATIITVLVLRHTTEPYVVLARGIGANPYPHMLKAFGSFGLFCILLFITDHLMAGGPASFSRMMENGCISLLVSGVTCLIILAIRRDTREILIKFFRR